MKPTKRQFLGACAAAVLATVGISPAQAQDFPKRDITAIIQWGAGGATDIVMRGYAPYAEEALGRKIVLQNRPGAAGAIGANAVKQAPADGYTLLMGAEPMALYRVTGLAQFDYDEFYPINIAAATNTLVLVTKPNGPWSTAKELFDDIEKNPGKVKQYQSGIGSLPFTVDAMMQASKKHQTTKVPFDGDGPAIAALQGGHVDMGYIAIGAVSEHIKAGRLKALAVIGAEPYENIPPITELPEFASVTKYLPWGPWYGVFVRKETPDDVKAKLTEAFKKAGENPQFIKLLQDRGATPLNLSGQEAVDFVNKFRSTTAWLYQDVGVAKNNPETLGIAKP